MRKSESYGIEEIVTNRNTLLNTISAYFPEHKKEIEKAETLVGLKGMAIIKKESVSASLAAKIQNQFPQSIR